LVVSILFKFIPKDLLIDDNSSININIMNFLSIDCSTDIGSLFLKTKNKTFNKVLQSDKLNNDLLMKQVLVFFEENNVGFNDISDIFVNQGPGNFSGLRGSLSTAKGMCLTKNLNLFGYNTFLWCSAKYLNTKNSILSIIKFRDKYFVKEFDKSLSKSSKVNEVTEDEILNNYKNVFKVIPKNLVKKVGEKILKLNNLGIEDLDHNLLESLKIKGLLDKDLIKPLYLS